MNDFVAASIHFAAAAITEALTRRGQSETYSAKNEIARLRAELAFGGRARGLDPKGEAMGARAWIESHVVERASDSFSRAFTRLELGRTERDILTLLFAWAIDPRVGLLFGHLHDALQRTRPSSGAIAEALRQPAAVATALMPSSTLRRERLVGLDREGPDGSLSIDPRVVRFLLDGAIVPLENSAGRLVHAAIDEANPSDASPSELARLGAAEVLVIRGATGAGRHRLASAVARHEGRSLIDLRLERADRDGVLDLVTAAARDAALLDARLSLAGAIDDDTARALMSVRRVPLVVILEPDAPLPSALLERRIAQVRLAVPPAHERARLWARELGRDEADSEIATIASRYSFTPGLIRRAAKQASSVGLNEAARLQLRHELDHIAQRNEGVSSWERLVVPTGTLEALQAICAQARQRNRVGDDWGFARHHALGHGVKALFYGRPGTGKSLAADIVARDLELPLYRIDLSRIVSKWIGETEQNLSRLFDEAAKSHGILFFDEADSLFAKRTAVHSSTDRYANMEVNHLLQRIEAHEGIVILATNLKTNIDDAFARRLHYVVDFPEPDAAAREQIWRISFPPEAPMHADVDVQTLAHRFEIPGGAIRNAVVGGAFLAASESSPIRQQHLARALRREFAKLDRLYQRAELDALISGPPRAPAS